ncbi:MAG: hypothetical protein OXK76_11120 [Gammaproteobacteria bacterium]|nr:hypothetical protein [Gammaproteobacteria bacterium]
MPRRYDSKVRPPTIVRLCALGILAWATSAAAAEQPAKRGVGNADKVVVNPYSQLSNEQLGTLAGTFEELDRDQRRWFLTEVRKRMSAKGDAPEIQVGRDDRFGRVVPSVDPADEASPQARKPLGASSSDIDAVERPKVYGTGARPPGEKAPDGSMPVVKSEDPSNPGE